MPFLIRSKAGRREKREAWQQVGLVSGFLAGRHFVGAKDLHYGYWQDGVEPTVQNLSIAQEEYCKFILSHIPADADRLLDIGSGAGKFYMAGAYYKPGAFFTGVEQRKNLVNISRNIAGRLQLNNVQFIHDNFTRLDFQQYDHFYFYNSIIHLIK